MFKFYLGSILIFWALNVNAQKIVAALQANDVIYVGMENPIDVAVEGHKNSEIFITAVGCKVAGSPDKKMVLTADKGRECFLTVGYLNHGDTQKQVFKYRVKQLRPPDVYYGALSEGSNHKYAFSGQKYISAIVPGLVNSGMGYKVLSYKWSFVSSTKFYSCSGMEAGNLISEDLKTLVLNGSDGDEIILDSVKCLYPNGNEKYLRLQRFQIYKYNSNSVDYDFLTHQIYENSPTSFQPYHPIYNCNFNPNWDEGIVKLYTIDGNDTQRRAEFVISSGKIINEKHFYTSGILFSEFNFEQNDTVGDASIYYENAQLMSKGNVINNRFNVQYARLTTAHVDYFRYSENILFINKFFHSFYPPIGEWKGYYKNGNIAMECENKLYNTPLVYDLKKQVSISETFNSRNLEYVTEITNFKIYDKKKKLIFIKD